MFGEIFKPAIDFYMANINYVTITLLMTIESSFIPFPSEVILPPAGWKAAQGELNLYIVMLCGILGSLFGAYINYFLSISLGRVIIYKLADTKIAHMLLITKENVMKAEDFFNKYGNISTFIGRLITVIRQLISIPAGLAKMNFISFTIFTILGASIWNIILTLFGYFLYSQKDLLDLYYNEISIAFVILGIALILFLILKNTVFKKEKSRGN